MMSANVGPTYTGSSRNLKGEEGQEFRGDHARFLISYCGIFRTQYIFWLQFFKRKYKLHIFFSICGLLI